MEKHATLIVQVWLEAGAGTRASVRATDSNELRYFKNLEDLSQFFLELGNDFEVAKDEAKHVFGRGLR